MYYTCMNCGKSYEFKKFKGSKYALNVCSIDCFKEYLNKTKNFRPDLKDIMNNNNKLKYNCYENMTSNLQNFRSEAEELFAVKMYEHKIKFEYESYSLVYRKIMYLPDFYLPEYKVFIEIKDGVWEAGAFNKVRTFNKVANLYLVTKDMVKKVLV